MAGPHKPKLEQIYFPRETRLCPICGKPSYSLAGEHPQCSVIRRDVLAKAKRACRPR